MAVNLFFLWSTTHLEPVSCAALANAMQPSPPIYHVSNRRVNYITQLSLFNNGGGHRGGIGLRIGRNLRAKPRPPSQNGLTAILIVSACVLIRSHPPAQCAPVCAGALLLRLALCVLLQLIATALTSNYRGRMWCVYQLSLALAHPGRRTHACSSHVNIHVVNFCSECRFPRAVSINLNQALLS